MDGPSLERNQVLGGGINSFMQTGLPIQCVGTKSHRCWMLPKLVWVFAEQRWGRKGFALGSWEDEYSGLAYHWPLDGSHSTAVSFSGLPTTTPQAQAMGLPSYRLRSALLPAFVLVEALALWGSIHPHCSPHASTQTSFVLLVI